MAAYNVFVPGYLGGGADDETIIQTGGLSNRPATGTLFEGVNAASAAAALAAVQNLVPVIPSTTHTWLVSNDTAA